MLTKILATFRELGTVSTVLYGTDRLIRMVSNNKRVYRYALVAQRVSDLPTLPSHRGKSIEVCEISGVDPLLSDLSEDLREEVLCFRKKQNAVCLAAFTQNTIIGCVWLCFGTYYEDEVRCRFSLVCDEGASWDFGLYIRPEYRNSVAFVKIWHAVKEYLQERRVCWSISRISAFNPHSIRSHARAGATSLGNVTFFCADPYQLTISRLPPYWHCSQDADSMPHFYLSASGEN